ncbi:MAG TPA: DEAD/DEAH box helicase [Thermomicrobiales bacterium]|nr:DEAD/DEAH box helicase [Thermomicrobiales bacterium]
MPRPSFLSRRRPAATAADPAKKSTEAVSAEEGVDGEESLDSLFDALDAPPEGGDPELGAGIDEVVDEGSENARLGPLADPGIAGRHGLTRPPKLAMSPRPYQDEAITSWLREGGRGVVVLPTGAGKTMVAMMAVARAGVRALVVVPTIELLQQWQATLAERLGYPLSEIGVVGGGKRTVRDLTVITYDSAAMPSRRLDGFGLLVVDEVHHLPARAYRAIAGKVNAPFRLGLSATPERSDGGHRDLDRLIGPVVYRKDAWELARDQHIASYDEKRLFVDLGTEEQGRYDQLMAEYRWYIASHRGSLGSPQTMFTEMIRRSGHDPAARSALRAHHQARMIALNADAKLGRTVELLEKHRDDKVIVFSEYNAMVDILAERLLLPAITYKTPLPERRQILERFRDGSYSKLVTGRVLNEGVDVPDANVAVVVSGSSATREYIQRLGRVLRPKKERALLYELITRRTTEGKSARKRRPAVPIDPDRRQRRLDDVSPEFVEVE